MIDVVYSQENESMKEVNMVSFFVLILNIIRLLSRGVLALISVNCNLVIFSLYFGG